MADLWKRDEDGREARVFPMAEPFGVAWERCWRGRYHNGHGQSRARSLIFGWLDARALREITREERHDEHKRG